MVPKTPSSNDRYPWIICAYYVLGSLGKAAYQGFMPVYFNTIFNDDTIKVGLLMGVLPLVSVFTQPMWGIIADRTRSKNNVLRLLFAGSLVLVGAYGLVNHSFLMLIAAVCLFAAFFTSIDPLADTISLENLSKGNHAFGPSRMGMSVAFGFASFFAGLIANQNVSSILPVCMVAFAIGFGGTWCLPEVQGHQSRGNRVPMTRLLRNRELMLLLVFVTILQLTLGYYYTYFPVLVTQVIPGGNSSLLGISYLISANSEVPFLLLGDRLFRKLGAGKLLAIAAAALGLRWLLLGAVRNIYWILALQLLHGWGFIVLTFAMAKYVSAVVPDELKASGQMLLGVVGYGVARVIGNWGGGLLTNALGGNAHIQTVFYMLAALCLATLATFGVYFFRKKPANGLEA